jgi:hypothetical protein
MIKLAGRDPNTAGQGTELIIKKLAPGSQFGQGYSVEVFDFGQKTDEVFVRTKKEVHDLIKSHKERYHTDKAFENEIRLHITWKTPNEQGYTKAFEELVTKLGADTMDIDQILLEKAAKISNLVTYLKEPATDRKFRAAEITPGIPGQATVPAVQTSAPSGEPFNIDEFVNQIKDRLVEYFSSNPETDYSTPEEQGHNEYNETKEWLMDVVRPIALTEGATQEQINQVVEKLKQVYIGSGLPGEDVILKAASFEADKLVHQVGMQGTPYDVSQILSKTPELEEIAKEVSETDVKNEAEAIISQYASILHDIDTNKEKFSEYANSFWKYVANYSGINKLSSVYDKWEKSLAINNEYKDLLKQAIHSDAERIIKTGKFVGHNIDNQLRKQALDNAIFALKKLATTIIINEKEDGSEEIAKENIKVPDLKKTKPKKPEEAKPEMGKPEMSKPVKPAGSTSGNSPTLFDVLKEE